MDFAIAFLALVPSLVLGWAVMRRLAPLGMIPEIAFGAGLGIAISSSIYFVLVWAGIANRGIVMATQALLLAVAIALVWRRKSEAV